MLYLNELRWEQTVPLPTPQSLRYRGNISGEVDACLHVITKPVLCRFSCFVEEGLDLNPWEWILFSFSSTTIIMGQITIILSHFNSLLKSPCRPTLAHLQSVLHSAAWVIFPKHKSGGFHCSSDKDKNSYVVYKALCGLTFSPIPASSCSPSPTGLLSVPHIPHPRTYALLHPHHHINSYSYFRGQLQVTSSGQPSLTRLKSPIIGSHLAMWCASPSLHLLQLQFYIYCDYLIYNLVHLIHVYFCPSLHKDSPVCLVTYHFTHSSQHTARHITDAKIFVEWMNEHNLWHFPISYKMILRKKSQMSLENTLYHIIQASAPNPIHLCI